MNECPCHDFRVVQSHIVKSDSSRLLILRNGVPK